jgi:hypothetical protein
MRLAYYLLCFMTHLNSVGQTFLGLSADFGNQVKFSPRPEGVTLKSLIFVSGSLRFMRQEEMRNDWFLQYAIDAGIIGYVIKVNCADTLGQSGIQNPPDFFFEYATLFGGLGISIGKQFTFREKRLSVLVGGGVTGYYAASITGSTGYFNSNIDVFTFHLEQKNRRPKGFVELGGQIRLNQLFLLGIRYSYHFNTVLEGTYAFGHINDPPFGRASLAQRALSAMIFLKIKK